MISIIFTLILFLWSTKCELLTYEIIVNPSNFFDNKYHSLSKNSGSEKINPYDENKACFMDIKDKNIIVYTQDYKTFVTSGEKRFEFTGHPNTINLISCFKFNSHSYLIFKKMDTEETVIIRGNHAKIFKNLKFDKILFDPIQKQLYLYYNYQIFNIEMDYLEEIWKNSELNYHGIIKLNYITSLESKTTDLLIINNLVYYINESKMYKFRIDTKKEIKFVSETNAPKFNYILFEVEKELKIGSNTNLWLTALYIIDVLIILACFYVFKKPKIFMENRRFHGHPLVEIISKDNDNDRVYQA